MYTINYILKIRKYNIKYLRDQYYFITSKIAKPLIGEELLMEGVKGISLTLLSCVSLELGFHFKLGSFEVSISGVCSFELMLLDAIEAETLSDETFKFVKMSCRLIFLSFAVRYVSKTN
jgi:hypothetical protein